MPDHTPGLSAGITNEDLFSRSRFHEIHWISVAKEGSNSTVKLLPLAKRPKQDGEQFAPTFTTEEVLRLASAQLPSPSAFQNLDVYIDGILPVAVALHLSWVCRLARSIQVNVPREGGWKKVSERPCHMGHLAIGDLVRCKVFGHEVVARVVSVSDDSAQVAEVNNGRRGGQRTWVREYDLLGWKE